MPPRARSTVLVLLATLLLASFLPMAEAQGRRVEFQAVRFDDTLFASIDTTYRVAFDEEGDIWYTTQAGLVHVDVDDGSRRLYTRQDGLPSSYALGLAVGGGKVYVATDLGLAILDRATGEVATKTPLNSPLPDALVQDVALIGGDVWIGTYFDGVFVWDPASDEWASKNTSTTAGYAKPVRRITATEDRVWVATDGDGAWRYDRSAPGVENADAWEVLLKVDGLPSNTVLAVAEREGEAWFGTDKGLARWNGLATGSTAASTWTRYTTADGMPHERVLDVDVIPTQTGSTDVFASTREGVWQYEVASGQSVVRAQGFGILGDYVFDNTFDAAQGWAFATQRGVSLLREGAWRYYTTGPSEGASSGPVSFHFTSASVGSSEFLWFGSASGVSAFLPSGNGGRGAWFNLGEWQYYPGSTVNHIDTDRGITWLATNRGTFGFNAETGEWIPKLARAPSRNLVYGVEADRGELWIALFGDGLLWQNLTTNESRAWDAESATPLPDLYLTDVRVEGDNVWLGAGSGAMRLNRISGALTAAYGRADGIPGSGVVFRLLPDGANVWVGTKDGGVGRLNVASGKVDRVWNATTTPGFPDGEVRALHREGGRLWVGTTEGLARIDLSTGASRTYNVTNSLLVQSYVNGISSRDGVLYLATLSGIARLDIQREAFLPLHSAVPGVGDGDGGFDSPPVVRIDAPVDGRAVTGAVTVAGTASRFGGAVDRVEVRIGEGDWQAAEGTSQWTFAWDTTTLPPNESVTIAARAIAGDQTSRIDDVLVTVVALPETPLVLEHEPPEEAVAGVPFSIRVRATGDDPLSVLAYYKKPGQDAYTRLALARQGSLFTGAVPAKDVREGELTYYVEARSGLLATTSPEDPSRPHRVPVGPPPSLAVDVEGPVQLIASAGATVAFDLNVTNTGSEPASFVLTASGLRATWLTVASAPVALEPGETRAVRATLAVPAAAFADETDLTFRVADTTGGAQPASAVVPLRVLAKAGTVDTSGEAPTEKPRGFFGIPGPAVGLVVAALAAVALARRRSA